MSLIFPSIRLRHVGWVSTNKLIIVTMFNPMFNPVRLLTQITNKRKTCTCRFHFFRCERKCLFSKFSFSWKSSKNLNTSPRSLLILMTWALLWFRQFCSQIIEMKEVCFLCEEPATATCQRCCRVRCSREESGIILNILCPASAVTSTELCTRTGASVCPSWWPAGRGWAGASWPPGTSPPGSSSSGRRPWPSDPTTTPRPSAYPASEW